MADSVVKIRVETEGIRTLADLEAAIKKVTASRKEAVGGSDEYKAESAELVRLKNLRAQYAADVQTDNGAMMKSYFTLGERLRAFYMEQRLQSRTFREVSSSAQALTGAFSGLGSSAGEVGKTVSGVFTTFDAIEFPLATLQMSAQQAGGKIAAIGTAFAGIALPATAAIAGVIYLLTQTKTAADALSVELRKTLDLQYELGLLSDRQYAKEIQRRQELTRKQGQKAESGQGFGILSGALGANDAATMMLGVLGYMEKQKDVAIATNAVLDDEKKLNTANLHVAEQLNATATSGLDIAKQKYSLDAANAPQLKAELQRAIELAVTPREELAARIELKGVIDAELAKRMSLADLQYKNAETTWLQYIAELKFQAESTTDLVKKNELENRRNDIIRERLDLTRRGADGPLGINGLVNPIQRGAPSGLIFGQGGGPNEKTPGLFTAQDALREKEQLNGFESSFNQSFGRMRMTISESIGGELAKSFFFGKTLLGQFVSDFIQQMTSLTSLGLIKGLFSMIVPGGGGFLSGFLGAFGLNASSNKPAVQQMNDSAMSRRGAQTIVVQMPPGGWRMAGTDMVYVVEKSSKLVRAGRAS